MDIIMTAANTIDLTPICEAIIALLAAVITMYLIPWIKVRTNEQQQAYIHAAVKVAVYAAEKLYGAGNGDMKLAYAQRILEDSYNIKLDAHKIGAAVDAAIKDMEMHETPILLTGEIETAVELEEAETEDEEPEPSTAGGRFSEAERWESQGAAGDYASFPGTQRKDAPEGA